MTHPTFRIPRTIGGLCLTIVSCFTLSLVLGLLTIDWDSAAFMPFVGTIEVALIAMVAGLSYFNKL